MSPKCKVTPNPSDINQSHLINYFPNQWTVKLDNCEVNNWRIEIAYTELSCYGF